MTASAFTRSTTFLGVFAGATRPYQPLTAKSAMPPSAAVGTSGSPGARCSAATESGFRRPAFAYGVTMEITDHM